jgi:hypothetical protein
VWVLLASGFCAQVHRLQAYALNHHTDCTLDCGLDLEVIYVCDPGEVTSYIISLWSEWLKMDLTAQCGPSLLDSEISPRTQHLVKAVVTSAIWQKQNYEGLVTVFTTATHKCTSPGTNMWAVREHDHDQKLTCLNPVFSASGPAIPTIYDVFLLWFFFLMLGIWLACLLNWLIYVLDRQTLAILTLSMSFQFTDRTPGYRQSGCPALSPSKSH